MMPPWNSWIMFILFFFFINMCSTLSVIIFTIHQSDRHLKELVGSIHYHLPDHNRIVVFGSSSSIGDEISLWRRVKFIDIHKNVLFTQSSRKLDIQKVFSLLVEYLFEEELADKVIYIESGHVYEPKLIRMKDVIGSGFQIYSKKGLYPKVIQSALKSIRLQTPLNLNQFQFQLIPGSNLSVPRVNNESKWACSIQIRKELIFSSLFTEESKEIVKKSVALLIPSKTESSHGSRNGNEIENDLVKECALVKYFIPSLLKTTGSFTDPINLYIGYDVDDPVFSKPENQEYINRLLYSKAGLVRFVELPHSGGWLTFIWNYLFVRAYADGNEYFIQLNDDIKFLSSGWLNTSISLLPDSGVIGFHDNTWQCKLFTQTLVNRNHYKIFSGHYFPLELRDWFSDNWITSVYGPNASKCNAYALISNGHVSTRYDACDGRNYRIVLQQGKERVKLCE